MQSEILSVNSRASIGEVQVQTCLSSMDVDCEQSLTTLGRNLSQIMPTRKERHCLLSPSGSEERDFKQTLTKQKDSLQTTLSGTGTQDNTKTEESLGEPRVCLTGQTDRQPESSMKNEDITPRIHTPEKQKKEGALTSDRKTASQQAESSWSTKESENSLASIHTPDKQKHGEGALTRDHKNAVECTESSGKSGLSKSDISRSRSVVYPNTGGKLVTDSLPRISVSSDQQTNLNYPTEQDLAKIKIESGLRITNSCVQPLQHTATCINCVADSLSQDEGYAIKTKVNNDCNSKFDSSQEESTVAVISSDYVSSSQMDVVTIQPLKGLHVTTEEHCLSSSETSQSKTNSDESYSVLQGRSSLAEKSPDVSIVPSSENSEEYEFEQPLPNVTPGRTAKRIHCSLSESQLENLFEASISFDDVTTSSCFEDAPAAKHKCDPRNKERECSLCTEKLENKKSSSDVSSVQNTADNQPCVESGQDLAKQKSVHENESKEENVTVMDKSLKDLEDHEKGVINRTPIKTTTTDFDVLFSQNTWSFSQSSDLIEIDRRQSVKRKRSDMDASHAHFICASDETKQANETHLRDSPVSPGKTPHPHNLNKYHASMVPYTIKSQLQAHCACAALCFVW